MNTIRLRIAALAAVTLTACSGIGTCPAAVQYMVVGNDEKFVFSDDGQ